MSISTEWVSVFKFLKGAEEHQLSFSCAQCCKCDYNKLVLYSVLIEFSDHAGLRSES